MTEGANAMTKPLTDALLCPFCNEDDAECHGKIGADGLQQYLCTNCGSSWHTVLGPYTRLAASGERGQAVAVPQEVADALRLYVREVAAHSMGESNDAASAEADFAIVARTWLTNVLSATPATPGQDAADALSNAARDVLAERARQVSVEGWTPEHDDNEHRGELQIAAACLCVDGTDADVIEGGELIDMWGLAAKHHGNWRRQLVIAGALILAAIEKTDRAALAASPQEGTK